MCLRPVWPWERVDPVFREAEASQVLRFDRRRKTYPHRSRPWEWLWTARQERCYQKSRREPSPVPVPHPPMEHPQNCLLRNQRAC